MNKKTIKDVKLEGKNILIRVDYNVSFGKRNGKRIISDNTRIRQSLKTIKYVISQKPKKIVLISHLGKPKNGYEDKFSLKIVCEELSDILGQKVFFVEGIDLKKSLKVVFENNRESIFMLENTRFWKGEKKCDKNYSKQLSKFGDIFVNDAFGSSHRAHASVVGVADYLPAVSGLLLEREVDIIDQTLKKPEDPFVVVLGGAKATTKIPMIFRLMEKANYVLLGGGVANTFLKAFGYKIGRSIYSPESLRLAQNLIWRATRANTKLYLPTDVVLGNFSSGEKFGTIEVSEIPPQFMALDIGKKTRDDYEKVISKAKTIIWNGPMGANEIAGFRAGTKTVYDAIVSNQKAVSIVGGGDTLASIKNKDDSNKITHISTGGGAMLEFIEKGSLPGIMALQDK